MPADEKKGLSALFETFLGKGIQDRVRATAGPAPAAELEAKVIHFLLIQVAESDLATVPRHMALATDIIVRADASVETMLGSILFATIGAMNPRPDDAQRTNQLAAEIVSRMAANARVIWGARPGLVGLIGTQERMNYGSILPRFSEMLRFLTDTPYGVAREARLAGE